MLFIKRYQSETQSSAAALFDGDRKGSLVLSFINLHFKFIFRGQLFVKLQCTDQLQNTLQIALFPTPPSYVPNLLISRMFTDVSLIKSHYILTFIFYFCGMIPRMLSAVR